MTKKQRTFITFEIDPETRQAFSDRVASEGKTVSGTLKQFINDYLSSESAKTDSGVAQEIEAFKEQTNKRLEEIEAKLGKLAA
jgi:hypothetical protein